MTDGTDPTLYRREGLRIVGWVALAAASAYLIVQSMWSIPTVALVAMFFIGCLSGLGVVTSVGAISAYRRFLKTGYRVHFEGAGILVYEEVSAQGMRQLSLVRQRLATVRWHRAGWKVTLPSEATWNERVPAWAKGRRSEIMERIVAYFGGGTEFSFADEA